MVFATNYANKDAQNKYIALFFRPNLPKPGYG